MNALKADPRTVDLRALAPHFYSFGVRILDLFDEEEIVDILSDVSYKLIPFFLDTSLYATYLRFLYRIDF